MKLNSSKEGGTAQGERERLGESGGGGGNALDPKTIMKSFMNLSKDEYSDWSYKITSVTFILNNVIKITSASLPLTLLPSSMTHFGSYILLNFKRFFKLASSF